VQVTFKAKEVPAHVKEKRLLTMLEKQEQRKQIAREEAQKKLESVNEEFAKKQGRVANSMALAMQPFVGTVEDNIMCMLQFQQHASCQCTVHDIVAKAC
jgi:hypothetical protein